MSAELKILLDRAELGDVVPRYATAIDLRDWDLLADCFTEDLVADFRTFGVREVFRGKARDWIALVASTIDGCDATQHLMANLAFDIRGDAASGTAYIRAEHFLINDRGGDSYTVGGYYKHRFARVERGWRISEYTLNVTWSQGNRHVLALATRRAAQRDKGEQA